MRAIMFVKGAVMMSDKPQPPEQAQAEQEQNRTPQPEKTKPPPQERGGPKGPEPTRYGDWENNGRCTDF